jgi:hypothetical protein
LYGSNLSRVALIFPRLTPTDPKEGDWHMPSCRTFLGFALSIGCSIAFLNPAFSQQQYPGTMAQQLACTPDVFRLCGAQIPDVNRIVACLRQNTPQLSGACRAVFESNARASDPAAPRRRDEGTRSYEQRSYEQRSYQQ